jgi:hypothetical protein
MAMDCGGYLRTVGDARPGHVVKCPASMAAHHVERAGEKDGMSGGIRCSDVGRGLRVDTPPVAEDLVMVRTTIPRSVMVMEVLVKIVEQPWSQSWPMERSELDCREGKMCAKRAESGRPGILSKPVCVLEMVVPSERVEAMLSVSMATASRVLEIFKKLVCGSGVDDGGGGCRRVGGRLCG